MHLTRCAPFYIMLYQLTFFSKNVDKPMWRQLRNTFYYESPIELQTSNVTGELAPLWQYLRMMLKTKINLEGILYVNLDSQIATNDGGIALMTGQGGFGFQVPEGQMRFKDVCSVRMETMLGRHPHHWLIGALDETDIIKGEGNETSILKMNDYAQAMIEINNAVNGTYVKRFRARGPMLGAVGAQAGQTINKFYGPRAVNAHELTRRRFRFKGQGENVLTAMKQQVFALQSVFEYVNARYANDGAFTFSDVFPMMVSTISGVKGVYEVIKPYLQDADEDEATEARAPVVRFGMTGADILGRWSEQAQKALEQVQELPKKHRPYTDGPSGDEFLRKVDADPYLDELSRLAAALARTLDFDAYNPHAYVGQEPSDAQQPMPDFVIMQM